SPARARSPGCSPHARTSASSAPARSRTRRRPEPPDEPAGPAADGAAAAGVERVHDDRLVRTPEGPRHPALVVRCDRELGDRAVRVPAAGARKPHRLRLLHAAAAEDPAGGDHAVGLRAVRRALHERAHQARLPLGRAVHAPRGLLHLPLMTSAFAQSSPSEKYRHIVVEGPLGAGMTSLARKLAERFGAQPVLEDPAGNPFLERFYADSRRYALPTQLFFLFQRVNQLRDLAQQDLFAQAMVGDFLLDKDPLFARLT